MSRLLRVGGALSLGLALSLQPLAALAMAGLEAPAAQERSVELARGGGRGGGGGRSRASGGGGGRARSSGARTGFSSYGGGGKRSGGANRPAARSADRSAARTDRSALRTDRAGNRQADRSNRAGNRQNNRTDRVDIRQENRTDRVHDRNKTRRNAINTWDRNRPNWVGPNWGYNRPWRYGWYGGNTWNSWGWWPGRAAAWGLGTLATFAVIDSLVDSAVSNQTTYIAVPDSSYSLYYSSVQPSGDVVTFQADNGGSTIAYSADCRAGTLNGSTPQSASEAQLVNAACQVAFGE